MLLDMPSRKGLPKSTLTGDQVGLSFGYQKQMRDMGESFCVECNSIDYPTSIQTERQAQNDGKGLLPGAGAFGPDHLPVLRAPASGITAGQGGHLRFFLTFANFS